MSVEEELFRRAQAGDRAAFDRLRAMLDGTVRRFIRRLVGVCDAEEDVAQDAFVALYLHRNQVEPAENLRPFLFRIVRNRCYSELRRRGRFRAVSLDGLLEGADASLPALIDARPRPDERAQWLCAYAQALQEIQRLPELQRQTLILFCMENMSYAQVAVATATDPATVKSRLHLARHNLKKRLRPEVLEALGLPPTK
jgi:RNA polymerase sigma-70 factor (ECF subfamily)